MTDWKAAEAYVRTLQVEGKDIAVHGPTLDWTFKEFLDAHAKIVSPRVLASGVTRKRPMRVT
jgi:hypothetical protein